MIRLPELLYIAAIVAMAVWAGGGDPLKDPQRIDVCLVASGPEGEDVTTNLWDDQIEVYFEKYPRSYCGRCGSKRECPTN